LTDRTYESVPGPARIETSPPAIEVGSEWQDDGLAIVTVKGEVDAFSAGILRRQLLAAVAAGATTVVVDLDATTFIDSATLGVLLGAMRRLQARGGELRVACAGGPIQRTFELTQLDRVLPMFGTIAEALPRTPL
jgi:anti-sigma B factor antagonist